ncbi:olee1-like protein [Tasmannia lanceolata]|uniref:olee1-like protein n=1 Tax=Tasmannia lanceolata TaxID=3420 RepID=UPI004064764E
MAKFHALSILATSLCFFALFRSAFCHDFIFVEGKVYCDTCRLQFETRVSEYMPAAKVRVECLDRTTGLLTYTIEGLTDPSGNYKIPVEGDHEDEICEAVLVSSSRPDCNEITLDRSRARIQLSKNNGIVSDSRFANPLGFMKKEVLPICQKIMRELELI